MNRKSIISFFIFIEIVMVGCHTSVKEPVDYVNNRIGNISILLVPTFPTTHLPNSMLRMIPAHTEFVTDRMAGFPLNVPSHRWGDVLHLLPFCGDVKDLNPNLNYRYDQERSTPYRYSVWLDDYGIVTDFAPAAQSAVVSFAFERDAPRYIMLRTVNRGKIHMEGNTMSGFEICNGKKHYFWLEFEQRPVGGGGMDAGNTAAGYVQFAPEVKTVRLRYGISYISTEQAKKNLEKEITDYDVNRVAKNARDIWNKTLSRIEVEGGTENQKAVFYTALYRTYERMINISEDRSLSMVISLLPA
ncbi:hypothetical protein EZS27_010431 [termite gut metagenome]|uniref:Glycosyl hydrolase family 92 N-terminal domain-containing protein n=1 Tax=termite gut metagenome TaxID=433724 RepID=A0A5J4S955_9ZZZZ